MTGDIKNVWCNERFSHNANVGLERNKFTLLYV
jgi:hypothetical protein